MFVTQYGTGKECHEIPPLFWSQGYSLFEEDTAVIRVVGFSEQRTDYRLHPRQCNSPCESRLRRHYHLRDLGRIWQRCPQRLTCVRNERISSTGITI
jgi:hypothetical protein